MKSVPLQEDGHSLDTTYSGERSGILCHVINLHIANNAMNYQSCSLLEKGSSAGTTVSHGVVRPLLQVNRLPSEVSSGIVVLW